MCVHAVALGEVAVCESVFQIWNLQKITYQRHPFMVGIGQHVGGSQVIVVLFDFQTAVGKFAQNGKSRAGSTDGLTARDICVDGILYWRAFQNWR